MVPRMQDRRLIGVTLHLKDKLLTAARIEPDCQQGCVDLGGLLAGRDAVDLVFAICPALDDDRARLGFAQIDKGDHGAGIGHFRDQGGHILRHSGAALRGVKVSARGR